jgi:transposase-like protein
MADGSAEEKTSTKVEFWRERVAEHGRSGVSVKEFCKERGLSAWSFYCWRKRLREQGPVRFALVERSARRQERTAEVALELELATGERLRIAAGVDPATLRVVLDVLRG